MSEQNVPEPVQPMPEQQPTAPVQSSMVNGGVGAEPEQPQQLAKAENALYGAEDVVMNAGDKVAGLGTKILGFFRRKP